MASIECIDGIQGSILDLCKSDVWCYDLYFQFAFISINDDSIPELVEHFVVFLARVESVNGVQGSTPTSGASIDAASGHQNLTVPENDHPYGLLQLMGKLPDRDILQEFINPIDRQTKVRIKKILNKDIEYSRTSIIRPSIIRISGLTEPKSCLPTGSTCNEQSGVSDMTGFYTFSETINSSALSNIPSTENM